MRAEIIGMLVVLTVGCGDSGGTTSKVGNESGGSAGASGSGGSSVAGTSSSGGASTGGASGSGGLSGSGGAPTGGTAAGGASGGASTGGTSTGGASGGAGGSGGAACRAPELVFATRATGSVVAAPKLAPNPDGSVWVVHSNQSFSSAQNGTVDWGQGSVTVAASDVALTQFDVQGVASATLVRTGKKSGVPIIRQIQADSDGALNILGRGQLVLGPVAGVYTNDGFLGHLNPSGTNAWVVEGGVGEVFVGASSAVTLAGLFQSAFQLDGQWIRRAAGENGWIARLNASGHAQWVQSFGGGSGSGFSVAGVGVLSDGSSIVVGSFKSARKFGDTDLTPDPPGSGFYAG